MFGKKKKYIKKWDQSSNIETPSSESKPLSRQAQRPSKKYRGEKENQFFSSFFENFETMKEQDSLLLESERLENRVKKSNPGLELIQKPAFKPLIILSGFLSFKFSVWLLSLKFFNASSTAGVILIIPTLIGVVAIFHSVFYVWKFKLKSVHRVVIRKVLVYWKIILFIFYISFVKNIIGF